MTNITTFNPTEVAQAFFDGSSDIHTPGEWNAGAYKITSPWEAWYIDTDGKKARIIGLHALVGGIAYSLATSGEVSPESVSGHNISAVKEELERISCINLHKGGHEAGAAEYARVKSGRDRLRQIEDNNEFVPIPSVLRGLGEYRKANFS